MSSWSSYPKIYGLGHRALKDLLTVDVNVEEKVDGSQFSFGLVEPNYDQEGNCVDPIWGDTMLALKVRSKGAIIHIDAPEALFREACLTVKRLAPMLHQGWTYRGEVLKKPHHNALTYGRVPKDHIIIFDISTGEQEYLSYEDKAKEAERLGLEVVPLLFSGKVGSVEQFRAFMGTLSILGDQALEGVVVKPKEYNLYGTDKKVIMGKFVSEAFKEVHRKTWGEANPSNKDVISKIVEEYTTPARWQKALIHLRERGLIDDSPRDISNLIKEVPTDVLEECGHEIKDKLFSYAWQHIRRGITRGLPEWYKELLIKKQFEADDLAIADQAPERELTGDTPTHADPLPESSSLNSTGLSVVGQLEEVEGLGWVC